MQNVKPGRNVADYDRIVGFWANGTVAEKGQEQKIKELKLLMDNNNVNVRVVSTQLLS